MRCWARHGRSLKERGIADWRGKPEACEVCGSGAVVNGEAVVVEGEGVVGMVVASGLGAVQFVEVEARVAS
jgi:hypothetical protein